MKRHPVCITCTHAAYATIDTTIIPHVYKPDFFSLRSYFLDRKLGPVYHQIGGRVRSSFLLGQWTQPIILHGLHLLDCLVALYTSSLLQPSHYMWSLNIGRVSITPTNKPIHNNVHVQTYLETDKNYLYEISMPILIYIIDKQLMCHITSR